MDRLRLYRYVDGCAAMLYAFSAFILARSSQTITDIAPPEESLVTAGLVAALTLASLFLGATLVTVVALTTLLRNKHENADYNPLDVGFVVSYVLCGLLTSLAPDYLSQDALSVLFGAFLVIPAGLSAVILLRSIWFTVLHYKEAYR